jgi:hypothetical protein
MLKDLRPFMSAHDLGSGVRWSNQLSKELDGATFGIVCLTPDNIHNDWILYEAGALTKHVDGRACCLLLQGLKPTDITGPLAQFQSRLFNKVEFSALIRDVNALLAEPLSDSSMQLILTKWWPDIESRALSTAGQLSSAPDSPGREPSSILEEVLLRVRGMQFFLERSVVVSPPQQESNDDQVPKPTGRHDHDSIKVTFKSFGDDISDVVFGYDKHITFQAFLNDIYETLKGRVPAYSYGTRWILRDLENGESIAHLRMKSDGTINADVRDHRSLVAVGIRPASLLEAIPLKDSASAQGSVGP